MRKAIEHPLSMQNIDSERAKVDALFQTVIDLYKAKHLADLEPSTQQMNKYLLGRYIEPKFGRQLIRNVEELCSPLQCCRAALHSHVNKRHR